MSRLPDVVGQTLRSQPDEIKCVASSPWCDLLEAFSFDSRDWFNERNAFNHQHIFPNGSSCYERVHPLGDQHCQRLPLHCYSIHCAPTTGPGLKHFVVPVLLPFWVSFASLGSLLETLNLRCSFQTKTDLGSRAAPWAFTSDEQK